MSYVWYKSNKRKKKCINHLYKFIYLYIYIYIEYILT